MEQLNGTEMLEVKEKVDKIYTCIVGDKTMGVVGIVEKMETMERELSKMKLLRDRIVIGAGVVSAFLMLLSWVGEKVYDLVKK